METDVVLRLLGLSKRLYPKVTPRNLGHRCKIVAAGLNHQDLLRTLYSAPKGSASRRILDERDIILGALVWPYQCATWDAQTRLQRIHSHYTCIDELPSLEFSVKERLVLADLSNIKEGARIVIDQPMWFLREGGLTINIFIGNFRAFSIAFSLFKEEMKPPIAFIGGVQGRNTDNALAVYRDLTKSMFGLRPRDLLLEALRNLCKHFEILEIQAVSDAARIQTHSYFGNWAPTGIRYDEIWLDRGGTPCTDAYFSIPVTPERRNLNDIKPKKRSLYKKRFSFLVELEQKIRNNQAKMTPICFEDC